MFNRRAKAERVKIARMEQHDNEAVCQFVSSKGLMKCCEIHQPLPNDAVRRWPQRILRGHEPGQRIYVHATALRHFARWALPRIRAPFVLVSGDSAHDVSAENLGPKVIKKILAHPHLVRWHSQNLRLEHPKVRAIPLGLDFHTIYHGNRPEWGPSASPRAQEELLQSIRVMSRPLDQRYCLGYSNWHFALGNGDRADLISNLPHEACYYEPERVQRAESWVRNTEFFFTISPRGVGMDCHRTWEAILLGSVPIIPDLPINALFETLPVVIVQDWAAVTPDFLALERERILDEEFDFAPVFLETWRRQLFDYPPVPEFRMRYQEFMRISPDVCKELFEREN